MLLDENEFSGHNVKDADSLFNRYMEKDLVEARLGSCNEKT